VDPHPIDTIKKRLKEKEKQYKKQNTNTVFKVKINNLKKKIYKNWECAISLCCTRGRNVRREKGA